MAQCPTDSILLLEQDGTIVALNGIAARRFNKPINAFNALIVTPIYDQFLPEVARYRATQVHKVVQEGSAVRFEDQQETVWMDNTIYPVFDALAQVYRLAVFSRDITKS